MNFKILIQKLQDTHNILQASAAKSVNITMTLRNWLFGFYIVEYEQNGEDRATYGEKLIRSLERKLKSSEIKGMSFTNLNIFRQFYLTYPEISHLLPDIFSSLPIIQTLPEQLPDINKINIIQTPSEQLQKAL